MESFRRRLPEIDLVLDAASCANLSLSRDEKYCRLDVPSAMPPCRRDDHDRVARAKGSGMWVAMAEGWVGRLN